MRDNDHFGLFQDNILFHCDRKAKEKLEQHELAPGQGKSADDATVGRKHAAIFALW
jgi:hypothetical protein